MHQMSERICPKTKEESNFVKTDALEILTKLKNQIDPKDKRLKNFKILLDKTIEDLKE